MEWIATCPHETVDFLAIELEKLGINQYKKLHRGIRFQAENEQAYRAHLGLRTASRIQKVLCDLSMHSLADLQKALEQIDWPKILRSHRPFMIRPTLADEESTQLGEEHIIAIIKESVLNSKFEKSPPKYNDEADNPITIVLFVRDQQAVLAIDTAGRALHKRGWRTNGHPAVIKETMAATILMMADYDGSMPLFDPMCGSGTIAIEAVYIALNKAPLIHRGKDDFSLEHLVGFDRILWRKISDELRAQKKNDLLAPVYANDINEKYVEVARKSALKARVEKYMQFSCGAFQDLTPPAETGLLVCNLPYGERIGRGIAEKLLTEVGQALKTKYAKWKIALLIPSEMSVSSLQIKPKRIYNLFNGALPVKLVIIEPRHD
jgi:putative N6-adenine-specific DNA methylase